MTPPPPLRRSRRCSPPPLPDDDMSEIFLRLPPDDPASLIRAAVVCKGWRGIISDAAFARLYRAFHGPAPMLGFFYNSCYDKHYETHCVSRFVSAGSSSFCPPGCRDRDDWFVLDSRHGRVLFWTPTAAELVDFVVCDPMTDARWKIPLHPTYSAEVLFKAEGDDEFSLTFNAAVMCSNYSCDHLDCCGGPFLVVLVGSDEAEGITFAAVYSSETGEWRETISVGKPNAINDIGHSVLLEDKLYFPCERKTRIVAYNVGEHELSVINTPLQGRQRRVPFDAREHLVLMAADDGLLLFVGEWDWKLHLWSMDAGAVAWARCRVIDLKPALPPRTLSNVSVVGAMEGANVIFVRTVAGLFRLDLSSGRSTKVYKKIFFEKLVPYTSFFSVECTGGCRGTDEARHTAVDATAI